MQQVNDWKVFLHYSFVTKNKAENAHSAHLDIISKNIKKLEIN